MGIFLAVIAGRPRALVLLEAHEDSMSEEPLLKEQTAQNAHTMTCHNTRGRTKAHRRAGGTNALPRALARQRERNAERKRL